MLNKKDKTEDITTHNFKTLPGATGTKNNVK